MARFWRTPANPVQQASDHFVKLARIVLPAEPAEDSGLEVPPVQHPHMVESLHQRLQISMCSFLWSRVGAIAPGQHAHA